MATITNKNIVNDIIRAGGKYGSDPAVVKIVEYAAHGKTVWGVVYVGDRDPAKYDDRGGLTIWPVAPHGRVAIDDGYSPGDPKGQMLHDAGWRNV